jgi:3D (Asp-Asp-Asp) domain-containing protein
LKRATFKFYSAKQRFAAKNGRIRKVFPKSIVVSFIIRLIAVICILGCIFCIARTKANSSLLLLSTTATENNTPTILDTHNSAVRRPVEVPVENQKSGIESTPRSDEWQTVRMRVTAYCPCEKCCGKYSDGITACGHVINPGDTFAAADRQYPFGTEMIVAGYNNDQPIKVLDRGGAIRGDRLDLFFHTHEAALQWGVKYIDVKVHRK